MIAELNFVRSWPGTVGCCILRLDHHHNDGERDILLLRATGDGRPPGGRGVMVL